MTVSSSPTSTRLPTVGVLAATAVVIADMIGVGVFTSLGFQVVDLPSGFSIIVLWLVGGVVALCGALCYAELSAMFPRSSGEYNFLSRSYHPAIGFMAGWLSSTVGFSAPIALAAMAFGQYAKALVPMLSPLLLGLAVLWGVTLVHLRGIREGSTFHVASTLLKIALILAFVIAGFAFATPQPVSFTPAHGDFARIISAPFAIGLVFAMYSYSGWNAATYIIGEIRDPHRTLPIALLSGTLIVIVLYVAVNTVFLYSTPISAMAGHIDVALVAGDHIFGDRGGEIVALLISIGLISAISAMIWIGPRVAMTMGEDYPVLAFLARRSPNGTPRAAILLNALIATGLLLTQSFEAVLNFIQFGLLCCSFLTVLGVVKLRITRPDLPRPYRAWGYPVTPFIFLLVMGFTLFYLAVEHPLQSLAGFLVMLGGILLFVAANRAGQAPAGVKSK